MTTVALLRTTYLNGHLRRVDAAAGVPWTDNQCNQNITDALTALFVDGVGKRSNATAAVSQASDVYTIPAALQPGILSRIEIEQTSGGITRRVDRITNWHRHSDTQVRIQPLIGNDSSLALRFFGWIPFLVDATDLPVMLEHIVAYKAAALCYSDLASFLANVQTQQGLDSSRVVDYPTAVGLSALWERRYRDSLDGHPNRYSLAPRRASR